MTKCVPVMVVIVVVAGIVSYGCQEPLVGAPCVPETEDGEFDINLGGTSYGIETRSVQCETSVCITTTKPVEGTSAGQFEEFFDDGSGGADGGVNTYAEYALTQEKFSFCSCRCKTVDGQTYDRQNDKLDDLCVCPGTSKCEDILPASVDVAENIAGSYCIPKCIADGCEADLNPEANGAWLQCVPSNNDEEPWKWRCVSCTETDNPDDCWPDPTGGSGDADADSDTDTD